MKIEKIVKLKSGKYKIYLDIDEILITYDDVILKNDLLFHKEINENVYLRIKEESRYYELLNSCIKLISKRLRSEKELKKYLENKTLDIYLIDNIISDLKQQKLINDNRFAQAYINDKINMSNNGILKIKNDLYNLGINEDIINEEINKLDIKVDENKLEKIILKKMKMNHKYSNTFLKQKILNEMINLGYEKNDVIRIFDKYIYDDKEIYKKEYNKIYNKLKRKYQGSELEYQVKQKMFSKGFKI